MGRSNPAAAARAAMPQRYGRPARAGRLAAVVTMVTLGAAGTGWLLFAAWEGSTPEVDAGVSGFEVVSDRRTDVTVVVRRGIETAVSCEVYAQAEDKAIVGERRVELPSAAPGTEQVTVPITTERRATTAVVRRCVATQG